jgi:hypothetical protein
MSNHLSYPSTRGEVGEVMEVEMGVEAAMGEEKGEVAVEAAGLVVTQGVSQGAQAAQVALVDLVGGLTEAQREMVQGYLTDSSHYHLCRSVLLL